MDTGCTLTAVPRSTQPSTLRGTVNEYQPYGWVIIPMAMGECLAIAAYRRTQRSSLQLGLRVGGHLALTDFRSEDLKWTLAYAWRHTESTINIVPGNITSIISINHIIWPWPWDDMSRGGKDGNEKKTDSVSYYRPNSTWLVTSRRTCRVVTWQPKWNLGLTEHAVKRPCRLISRK